MAPEQIRSARHADARTDVWSLGVLLYEVIAGDIPFPAETAASMFVQITIAAPVPIEHFAKTTPPELSRIITRCLRKDPAERYNDANELATDLRAVLRGGVSAELLAEHDRPTVEGARPPPLELQPHAPSGQGPPPAPASAPSIEEEVPSGLRLATLRPPSASQRRAEIALRPGGVRAAGLRATFSSVDRGTIVGTVIHVAIVVVICGALTLLAPVPQDLVRDTAIDVFGHMGILALAGVAAVAVALSVATGVIGVKRSPISWGMLVSATGLLVLGALVAGVAWMGDSAPSSPIAFASGAALVPTGAAVAVLTRASRAWRGDFGLGKAGSIALAVVAALALFVAALFLRAGT
jgi:hypothetical protein